MLATAMVAPIPAGILTTISVQENLVKALCCLGALGAAIGLGMSGPITACNKVLAAKDIPIGNAILVFGGGIGSSLFISVSSALFQNRLVDELRQHSPATNITSLENVGLTEIRKVVNPERLNDVLFGYDEAVTQTLYVPVALMVLSLVGCLATEWKSVKQKTS
jgi:hypothetical protein